MRSEKYIAPHLLHVMKMFDSHAHYDDSRYENIVDELLLEVHSLGVEKIANIGASLSSSRTSVALAKKYDFVYASVGIHPSDAVEDMKNKDWIVELEQMYKSSAKVVAIGEIGLDYHYGKDDMEEQKICFEKQMALAEKLSAPVIIHDREAHEDTLKIMEKFPDVKGVLHSFSGSFEMAKQIMKMGYYISINGVATFNNAKKLIDILCRIDEVHPDARSRLLMETDCPYLTPVPFRGQTNRSDYMKYTAQKAAECLGITPEEFCELTYNNACRFYGIA